MRGSIKTTVDAHWTRRTIDPEVSPLGGPKGEIISAMWGSSRNGYSQISPI